MRPSGSLPVSIGAVFLAGSKRQRMGLCQLVDASASGKLAPVAIAILVSLPAQPCVSKATQLSPSCLAATCHFLICPSPQTTHL